MYAFKRRVMRLLHLPSDRVEAQFDVMCERLQVKVRVSLAKFIAYFRHTWFTKVVPNQAATDGKTLREI